MRWLQAGMGVLALMMMTGCPSEFGKDGRVNKAIHQDTVDLYLKRCNDQQQELHCGGDKQGTPECRKHCG
jgi:hypothetical protein